MGIGLSIVEAIARAHGGTATVTSPPGGGARFDLTFPVVADDAAVGLPPPTLPQPRTPPAQEETTSP
jgi:hypothetical protein